MIYTLGRDVTAISYSGRDISKVYLGNILVWQGNRLYISVEENLLYGDTEAIVAVSAILHADENIFFYDQSKGYTTTTAALVLNTDISLVPDLHALSLYPLHFKHNGYLLIDDLVSARATFGVELTQVNDLLVKHYLTSHLTTPSSGKYTTGLFLSESTLPHKEIAVPGKYEIELLKHSVYGKALYRSLPSAYHELLAYNAAAESENSRHLGSWKHELVSYKANDAVEPSSSIKFNKIELIHYKSKSVSEYSLAGGLDSTFNFVEGVEGNTANTYMGSLECTITIYEMVKGASVNGAILLENKNDIDFNSIINLITAYSVSSELDTNLAFKESLYGIPIQALSMSNSGNLTLDFLCKSTFPGVVCASVSKELLSVSAESSFSNEIEHYGSTVIISGIDPVRKNANLLMIYDLNDLHVVYGQSIKQNESNLEVK